MSGVSARANIRIQQYVTCVLLVVRCCTRVYCLFWRQPVAFFLLVVLYFSSCCCVSSEAILRVLCTSCVMFVCACVVCVHKRREKNFFFARMGRRVSLGYIPRSVCCVLSSFVAR